MAERFGLILMLLAILAGCGSTVSAPVRNSSKDATRSTTVSGAPQDVAVARARERGYHIVSKGDTLYSIAFRYSLDYKRLAVWNRIKSPYTIYPEQVLRLKKPVVAVSDPQKTVQRPPVSTATPKTTKPPLRKETSVTSLPKKIQWRWPTSGKVIKLNSPTSQKGLNITGTHGQSVMAAAEGDVVYSGSGLLGYGKLIIIKHNDIYLSAYAHNDKLLVREGMKVASGQEIATMGIDDNRPVLHFEIRREGKPVDPLNHLPKKRS